MIALKERAKLDGSLLVRQRDLIATSLSPSHASERSPPVATVIPLFFRKGEASAEQFRRPGRHASNPVIVLPAAAIDRENPRPAPGGANRLWMRMSPERRQELNAAAACLGQTCQDFLLDTIDAFLKGHGAGSVPKSLAAPAPARRPHFAAGHRVKLSVRVDEQRHCAMKRAAARTGETVQNLLVAALERHSAQARVQPAAVRLSRLSRNVGVPSAQLPDCA